MSHISETVWSFDVKFGTLTCQTKKCLKPNFVGLSSETKKLLSDQILKFGLDFLKTCELWSTYFGIVGKPSRRNTKHRNIVGQSTKTKKL